MSRCAPHHCGHEDGRGVRVTAADETTAVLLDAAVVAYVQHRATTSYHLSQALLRDPDLVLAHCMVGFLGKLLGRSDLDEASVRACSRAEASLLTRGGTRREELVTRALRAWCDGDPHRALSELAHAQSVEPLDLLSMKLAHAVAFFLGLPEAMVASVEAAVPHWERSGRPELGAVLGCYAFGLHERGDVARALEIGHRAVCLDPTDPWAVHAVLHAFHSVEAPAEALRWLAERTAWEAGTNSFAAHIHWHRALFCLRVGRTEEALSIHDEAVAGQPPGDYRDLLNASTLLFRLESAGHSVGNRWEPLVATSRARLGDHRSALADAHHVLVLEAAGHHEEALRFVNSMAARSAGAADAESRTVAELGVPLCRAIAHVRCDPGYAVTLLDRHAPLLVRLGGSRAQRETFDLVRQYAARRATDLASG